MDDSQAHAVGFCNAMDEHTGKSRKELRLIRYERRCRTDLDPDAPYERGYRMSLDIMIAQAKEA
jgi:hypothetical protein